MWSETFSQIRHELSLLHRLIDTYHSLLEKSKSIDPNEIELMALAGVLHSFYMGFENIFKRIATEIDSGLRKSDSWHIDLLESMIVSTEQRSAVLTLPTQRRLRFYLGFRHVFRSTYSYNINWLKMKSLVGQSEEMLQLVEKELIEFMAKST